MILNLWVEKPKQQPPPVRAGPEPPAWSQRRSPDEQLDPHEFFDDGWSVLRNHISPTIDYSLQLGTLLFFNSNDNRNGCMAANVIAIQGVTDIIENALDLLDAVL